MFVKFEMDDGSVAETVQTETFRVKAKSDGTKICYVDGHTYRINKTQWSRVYVMNDQGTTIDRVSACVGKLDKLECTCEPPSTDGSHKPSCELTSASASD